jgi:biopolymer transport protein ExbB/TolQ
MFGFLFQFGIAGFGLFCCLITVCVISFERAYFLFYLHAPWKKDVFLVGLLQNLHDEQMKPLAIREAHITHEIERIDGVMSKGLIIIRFISVASPMLGLFGTILGMITIFGSIAESNQPVTPSLISAGLKEALYATAMGISIAVPSVGINLFFNHSISRRIQKYVYILNDENIKIDYHHND